MGWPWPRKLCMTGRRQRLARSAGGRRTRYRVRYRRRVDLFGAARVAGHRCRLRAEGAGQGARQGASPRGLNQLRSGRCHPPQLGPGRGDRVYVDRRQRLHDLTDKDRDAYVREVTAVAAPDALLVIGGLIPVSNLASAASLGPKSNAASLPRGRCCPLATHRKWPAFRQGPLLPSYSPAVVSQQTSLIPSAPKGSPGGTPAGAIPLEVTRERAQSVLTACSTARLFGSENALTSAYAAGSVEPPVRIELTTFRLQGECSTTEKLEEGTEPRAYRVSGCRRPRR